MLKAFVSIKGTKEVVVRFNHMFDVGQTQFMVLSTGNIT